MGFFGSGEKRDDDLFEAALHGDKAKVLELLADGADVDAKDNSNAGWTPLHCASVNGHAVVVEALLAKGANVNEKDNLGRTPLHYASCNGHAVVVEALLANGADADAKDNTGSMPLHGAGFSGRAADSDGWTPLHHASCNDHPAVVEALLSNGANVNANDNTGSMPLHVASWYGHAAVAEALLANGADVNAKDNSESTSLHGAGFSGRAADSDGCTPLHHGSTPLHLASLYGNPAVVEALLANGADVNVTNDDGRTPRDLAASEGRNDVVELLDKALAGSNPSAAEFYREMMALDRPGGGDASERLGALAALVEDVHMLKFFYTAVALLLRVGALSREDAARRVSDCLSRSADLCVCRDSIAVYKLVLKKAALDGHLSEFDCLRFDNDAEVARMANAPFVKDIVESVRANTARIEGLEANVESINASLDKIRRGIKRKMRLEGVVGLVGATLNVISLGAAGGLLSAGVAAFFEGVVDFGDVVHLQQVVADVGARFPDEDLMEQIEKGVEIGEEAIGKYADSLLEKAVKEGNVLVVVSANAAMQQQPSDQIVVVCPGQNSSEEAMHETALEGSEEEDDDNCKVEDWLLKFLPTLKKGDVANYRDHLIEKGFDSTELFCYIREEDLQFMKIGHRRMLVSKLSLSRDP